MRRTGILLFVLFLFLPVFPMSQESDWDKVLDRYEDICKQCITLRDRIQAGEPVSDRAVTSLLQELGQLRNTLQNASGSMTANQKKRFDAIRDSYSGNTDTKEPVKPIQANNQTAVIKQQPVKDTISIPNLSDITVAHPELPEQQIQVPSTFRYDELKAQEPLQTDNTVDIIPNSGHIKVEPHIVIAYNRTWAVGGMLIIGNEPLKSGYVSVLTNFSLKGSDYSCSSNGDIKGGGVFWGDGAAADNELLITMGPTVWEHPSGNISVYLGAGYGVNERLWQDISGNWAIVSDISGRGVVLQSVVALRYHRLSLSPSLTYMPSTNFFLPSLGLGYSF